MARHRSCSIAFKRQVVQEFFGGEALYGLARRHDVSRNLIRVWVAKYEAGAFDDEFQAADLLQQYEARPRPAGVPQSRPGRRADGPNQLWNGDITDVAVASGFVYVALILDAWSRRVVSSATLVPAYFDRQLNTSRG